MGRTVYLPTWMVDFDDFHVGKCTSPTDPMSFSQIWKFTIYRYLFFVQNSAFVSSFWCWKKQVDILSAMSKRIQTHDWMYLHILYFMQGSFWLGSILRGIKFKQQIYAGWWQLKYFWNFHPDPWGHDEIWLAHLFQKGWFNHQLVWYFWEISLITTLEVKEKTTIFLVYRLLVNTSLNHHYFR